MTVGTPEALEPGDRTQRILDPTGGEAPVEGRADVVELLLETLEPLGLIRARELELSGRRELEEPLRVPTPQLVELARGPQALLRVLTNGLEHRQPDVAVGHVATDEAPTDESLQVGEEGPVGLRDGACVIQRAAAREDGERPEQLALGLVEQAVAPLDRGPQRSLALGKVDRPFHLECKSLVERLQDV